MNVTTLLRSAGLTVVFALSSARAETLAPPVFTSPLTGVPNPAGTGQEVTFTAPASSSVLLLYTWDFGDGGGTLTVGGSVVHRFRNAGTYTVTVTVDDGVQQISSTTTETVNAPLVLSAVPGDAGIDSDGDGFSDQLEGETGFDPFDPNSTPTGNLPASADHFFNIKSISGKFTLFKTPSGDTISAKTAKTKLNSLKLTVNFVAPAGVGSAGDTIVIDVAGIVRSFTLDNKGQAKTGLSTLKVKGGNKKGAAQSSVTLQALLKDDQQSSTPLVSTRKTPGWPGTLVGSGIDIDTSGGKITAKSKFVFMDSSGHISEVTTDANGAVKGDTATVTLSGKY